MIYIKICKICKNEFETESSNQVYCSKKCRKRGAKKSYRIRKLKHIKSKDYSLDKQIAKLINKAHVLSREVGLLLLPYRCSCQDENHECAGQLELHHRDHNPFNIELSNLQWLCKKAHAEIHSQEEDCNIPNLIKAYLSIKNVEENNKEASYDELFEIKEYEDAVKVILEHMQIQGRNAVRQRDKYYNNMSSEEYELFTGEKKETEETKPTLFLLD